MLFMRVVWQGGLGIVSINALCVRPLVLRILLDFYAHLYNDVMTIFNPLQYSIYSIDCIYRRIYQQNECPATQSPSQDHRISAAGLIAPTIIRSNYLAGPEIRQVFYQAHRHRITSLDDIIKPLAHPHEVLSIPSQFP